jgi:hypothetical protein
MTEPKPYIPFLKLKQNEIMALKMLEGEIKAGLTPFFDFPNDVKGNTPENFINKAETEHKRIQKHLWQDIQFYIDTYDVNDLDINGQHSYEYLLDAFRDFSVIPVIGVDRTPEHKQAIINHMATQGDDIKTIAFRITTEDFQSYTAIQDEISILFEGLLGLFATIDLIFDNRICLDVDIDSTATHIAKFSQQFNQDYPVRKIIITGSSIPASLSDICSTHHRSAIKRNELLIYGKVKQEYGLNTLFGDYTTVSPLFSEPNVMAAMNGASKLIYADELMQYIWRGGSVRVYGGAQFNQHINELTQKSYYHSQYHSWADKRFYDTRSDKSGYSTSSIVKHLINAHISYMAKTHNY